MTAGPRNVSNVDPDRRYKLAWHPLGTDDGPTRPTTVAKARTPSWPYDWPVSSASTTQPRPTQPCQPHSYYAPIKPPIGAGVGTACCTCAGHDTPSIHIHRLTLSHIHPCSIFHVVFIHPSILGNDSLAPSASSPWHFPSICCIFLWMRDSRSFTNSLTHSLTLLHSRHEGYLGGGGHRWMDGSFFSFYAGGGLGVWEQSQGNVEFAWCIFGNKFLGVAKLQYYHTSSSSPWWLPPPILWSCSCGAWQVVCIIWFHLVYLFFIFYGVFISSCHPAHTSFFLAYWFPAQIFCRWPARHMRLKRIIGLVVYICMYRQCCVCIKA